MVDTRRSPMTAPGSMGSGLDGESGGPGCAQLCRGLVVLPIDDGILFEGGPTRQLLTGAAATSVVPRLLPLLDGRHTVAQVAAVMELTPGQARQAVALLDRCGLLEWYGDQEVGTPTSPPNVATFLSRTVNAARTHRNASQVLAELDDSVVTLVVPRLMAEPLREDLLTTGVGRVLVTSDPEALGELDLDGVATSTHGLVVMLDHPGWRCAFTRLERGCRDRNIPMLRFATRVGHVEIGPMFCSGYTACYSCFSKGCESMGWEKVDDPDRVLERARVLSTSRDSLAIGLVAAETLAILAQVTAPTCLGSLTRISVPDLTRERFSLVPSAGCRDCGGWTGPRSEVTELIFAYEWLHQATPPGLDSAPPGPVDQPAQAEDPEKPDVDWFASPRHRLPDGPVVRRPASSGSVEPADGEGSSATERDELVLADILWRVAGRRGNAACAPTIGPRAPAGDGPPSVQVYLLTEPGQFRDAPGTIFKYDGVRHELITVRSDMPPWRHYLAEVDLAPNRASVALILVGAVGQAFHRHGELGYRLAHLDSGAAAVQFVAMFGQAGIKVSFASGWDVRMPELLELRPEHEVITAVVLLQVERARVADP
jgi:hypothetical protein